MAKQKAKQIIEEKININAYFVRFALIYSANIIILLSLKYQAGLNDTLIFTIVIIILSARFTATKFIMDNKRLFTQTEKMKFTWVSWSLLWFISIIATTLLSFVFGGKEALVSVVGTFQAMPTLQFILTIATASAVGFVLLFVTYGFNAKREFEILKKQGKI